MKLEHLLQAYKSNSINAEVKDMSNEGEYAGVITFDKGITASYLLDDKGFVIAMKLFVNCLTQNKLNIQNQMTHTIKALKIMQKTIELLANIPQKECNMILEALGLFDNTFKNGKKIKHLEHSYSLEIIDGILCLSILKQ